MRCCCFHSFHWHSLCSLNIWALMRAADKKSTLKSGLQRVLTAEKNKKNIDRPYWHKLKVIKGIYCRRMKMWFFFVECTLDALQLIVSRCNEARGREISSIVIAFFLSFRRHIVLEQLFTTEFHQDFKRDRMFSHQKLLIFVCLRVSVWTDTYRHHFTGERAFSSQVAQIWKCFSFTNPLKCVCVRMCVHSGLVCVDEFNRKCLLPSRGNKILNYIFLRFLLRRCQTLHLCALKYVAVYFPLVFNECEIYWMMR